MEHDVIGKIQKKKKKKKKKKNKMFPFVRDPADNSVKIVPNVIVMALCSMGTVSCALAMALSAYKL